jgi:glycerol-3-phosphate dehydrogenase
LNEQTKTLSEVVDLLESKRKRKKTPTRPLDEPDQSPAEAWQIADLVNIAGYPEELARQLTKAEATKAWETFRSNELRDS